MFIIPIKKVIEFDYHVDGTIPKETSIFVFGSNLSGIHGAGAAREAHTNFGAKMGFGIGFCGYSYAIPTKGKHIEYLKLDEVKPYIEDFVRATYENPDDKFFVTRIGCQLAGFTDEDVAPLFKNCNKANCNMPLPWKKYIE